METLEKGKDLLKILKGIVISFLLTITMIFILSVLLCNTNLNENIINPAIIFISAFSVLIGSFVITKSVKKNGIIVGSIIGIFYILIIYLISSLLNSNFLINLNSLILIFFSIFCGAIGGIFGVNIKDK